MHAKLMHDQADQADCWFGPATSSASTLLTGGGCHALHRGWLLLAALLLHASAAAPAPAPPAGPPAATGPPAVVEKLSSDASESTPSTSSSGCETSRAKGVRKTGLGATGGTSDAATAGCCCRSLHEAAPSCADACCGKHTDRGQTRSSHMLGLRQQRAAVRRPDARTCNGAQLGQAGPR